ncbi:MAG: hypothetical protein ACKO1M_05325 [Planctomycetota bacterium]
MTNLSLRSRREPTLARTAAVLVAMICVMTAPARHGTAWAAEPPATADAAALARREADLARQYLELERSFLRLADLLATTDPRRAAVLRDAFDRARDAEVGDRLEAIVTLLEKGQLLKAGVGQEGAIEQFRQLLDLLEEGGQDRKLADTKQELRQFLGRVTKLIARQRDIEGSTETGADEDRTATRQREAAEEADGLAADLERFAKRKDDAQRPSGRAEDAEPGTKPDDAGREGSPSQGDKPRRAAAGGDEGVEADEPSGAKPEPGVEPELGGQPAAEAAPTEEEPSRERQTGRRLGAAEKRMRQAAERLDEARRKEAREEQERAIEELESARAELEEILRQMREEEVERLLVQLETRIRTMLKAEQSIRDAAVKLVGSEAMSPRERQLEAARLGREQGEVTAEAARALLLVRDDGSAVAIPQALGQVQDDSAEAATRLARGDVTPATVELVGEIVTGLEELLAAIEKSRQDDPKQQQAGEGGGQPAESNEQPLVDKLAELKMLRSLQGRVNTRTERFSRLLDAGVEQAQEAELVAALGRLAERQRAIEQAARDIVTGRTER